MSAKTFRELINIIDGDDSEVDEDSMSDAEHNPQGPHFAGYYSARQSGPPRPGQGFGGCEESADSELKHCEKKLRSR